MSSIVIPTASDLVAIEIGHGCAISVDLSAERDSSEDLLAHNLVGLVLRHVHREEAGVRLWQRFSAHIGAEVHCMGPAHARDIHRQARATPYKLEVHLALIIIERGHDSPEAFFKGRTSRRTVDFSDRL